VEAVLRGVDDLVREVRLFDAYEGRNLPEGKRSLAFAMVFQSLEGTLTPAEVERLRAAVQQQVEARGWTLRTG
jgi:phenylalanyl-tRNA synthetase beta chain